MMIKEDRHNAILEQLFKSDSVMVSELAELLDVSSVTIRKDLTDLEKAVNYTAAMERRLPLIPLRATDRLMKKKNSSQKRSIV